MCVRIAVLVVATLIAACAPTPSAEESVSAAETAAVDNAVPSTTSETDVPAPEEGKPSLPFDLALTIEEETVVPREPFTLKFEVTPRVPAERLILRFEVVEGEIELEGDATTIFSRARAGQTYTATVTARVAGTGRGHVRASVYTAQGTGEAERGPSKSLYFASSDKWVFHGTVGIGELALALAEKMLETGELTQEEYEDAVKRIRFGGAQSEIRTGPPR